MKLSRSSLLPALKIAQPALSDVKNQVQELTCFWFTGKTISAFNDVLGIRVDLDTDFKGGLPGDVLLGVLDKSRAQNITIEENEKDSTEITLKAGAARVRFGNKPLADWEGIWDWEPPAGTGYVLTKDFLDTIGLLLVSVGSNKTLPPEQRGVTFVQGKKYVDLYSTDAITLSYMQLEGQILPNTLRCIVPTAFCEQLRKIPWKDAELFIDKETVCCVGTATVTEAEKDKAAITTEVVLFSKLVDDEGSPLDFADHLDKHVDDKAPSFKVPTRMKDALDRAVVLLNDKEPVELEIQEGKLYLAATGAKTSSDIEDMMKLDDTKHGDIKVIVDPSHLRRGLDGRDTMVITKDVLVLTGPRAFVHIVATR